MNHSTIYLAWDDHAKLRNLLAATLTSRSSNALLKLREEVDRAVVMDPSAIPADVVTLDSEVEYEDLETNEVEKYVLTFPDRANIDENRLSILSPIGTALIGYREGDIVTWSTPGGTRQLKIRGVTAAAELLASQPTMPSWG